MYLNRGTDLRDDPVRLGTIANKERRQHLLSYERRRLTTIQSCDLVTAVPRPITLVR